MLDEKDLQAIAQLMDVKLREQKEEILTEFNAVIEDKVSHEIKVIAEGHKTILDRLPIADEQEQLKSRVKVLERVVIDLRSELDELKKAQ
jgi:hypothetical protein